MRIETDNHPKQAAGSAFTLIEVLVGSVIVGVLFISLFAGISYGFATIRLTRENLRATQILTEKTEVLRLCTWDQVNSNGFIPATFTAPYYLDGSGTNTATNGIVYSGTVDIAKPPQGQIAATYGDDLRVITVNLTWTSGGIVHNRRINTYYSRYGLQNYIFN